MNRSWSSTTRMTVAMIIVVFVFILAYEMRILMTSLVLAGLLAYTLNLAVAYLHRRTRLGRKSVANIVYFLFVGVLVATPGTLVPFALRQARTFSADLEVLRQQIITFLDTPIVILGRTFQPVELGISLTDVTGDFGAAFEGALTVVEVGSISLVRLVIIIVVGYYLVLDWDGLRHWLLNLLPHSGRTDAERLMAEINRVWRAYMQGTLALMLIMAVAFIIIGLALGLPGALVIGLLTGFFSMIPEIGPWISGIIATAVAFVAGSNFLPISNFWFAVLIAGIYAVITQVKSIWLRPQVMGRFMHMNTGLVFLAIIAAAILQGILAALIVLPVLATVGILGKYVRARLLDLDPWPGRQTEDSEGAVSNGDADGSGDVIGSVG